MAARKPGAVEEHTRDVLLDAAVGLLAEVGPEEMSLREVARRAGVSHTAPYNHFQDKQAMLQAVAMRGFQLLERAMAEAQAVAPGTPGDQLVAAGVGYVIFARREPALFRLMFHKMLLMDTPISTALQAELAKKSGGAFELLLKTVGNLHTRTARSSQELMDDAVFCWAHVHGLATMFTHQTLKPFGLDDSAELEMAGAHSRRLLVALGAVPS